MHFCGLGMPRHVTAAISLALPTFLQAPRNSAQSAQTLFPRAGDAIQSCGIGVWFTRLLSHVHLNKFVKRERYQCSTPAEAVADIASHNAKVFTKLDALKGYHQCPLDEDSQLLTTFPIWQVQVLASCISSISEHYNRRMVEAFSGLTGYRGSAQDDGDR